MRGVRMPIGHTDQERELESLDKTGVFCPLAYLEGPYTSNPRGLCPLPAILGEMRFREETGFIPWGEIRYEVFSGSTLKLTTALYSPWQLLSFPRAWKSVRVSITSRIWTEPNRDKLLESLERWTQISLEGAQGYERQLRQIIRLLVEIQNRYFPFVRGSGHLIIGEEGGDYEDPLDTEIASFDPQGVARLLDVDAERLKHIYQFLCTQGHFADTNQSFYLLLRMAPYSERDQLRGASRNAQDWYDAAEMVRNFYRDLIGELLPDCDEVGSFGRDWKAEMLGHPARPHYDQVDLQRVLKRHHLYPHRAHVLVEGDTEKQVVETLMEAARGLDAKALGIEVTDLGGVGNVSRAEKLLEAVRSYPRELLVVADREGEIARRIEGWKRAGLITDRQVHVWDTSFEPSNFTSDELVAIANTLIAELSPEDISIVAQDFQCFWGTKLKSGNEKGYLETFLGYVHQATGGRVKLAKGQFIPRLTSLMLDDIKANGWEKVATRRPILDIVERAIRHS